MSITMNVYHFVFIENGIKIDFFRGFSKVYFFKLMYNLL